MKLSRLKSWATATATLAVAASVTTAFKPSKERDLTFVHTEGAVRYVQIHGNPGTDSCLRDRVLFQVGGTWFNLDMNAKHFKTKFELLLRARDRNDTVTVHYVEQFYRKEFIERCDVEQTEVRYHHVRELVTTAQGRGKGRRSK